MEETDGSDVGLIFAVCALSFLGTTAGGVTGFGTSLVFISLWRVIQAVGWLHLGEEFARSDSVLCVTVFVLALYLTSRTWKQAYPNLVIGLLPGLATLQLVGGFVVVDDEYVGGDMGILRKVFGFSLLAFILLRGLALRSQLISDIQKKNVEASPGVAVSEHDWEEQIVCSYFCPGRYPEPTPRRASSHTSPNIFISFNSARLFWGQIPPNEQQNVSLSGRVAASIPTLLRSWNMTTTWLCALPYSGIFWGALVTGCLAGILDVHDGGSFGTGDTAALVYFTMLPLSKSQLRASFVVALCLTQPLQIISLANRGMFQQDDWPLYVGAPIFGLVGVLLGDWIHRFVNKTFTLIVCLFLVLAASVAYLSPMKLYETYGAVVLFIYIVIVVVFMLLPVWDQLTIGCWSSLSCIEDVEDSDPLKPKRRLPNTNELDLERRHHPKLSTIQGGSSRSSGLSMTKTCVDKRDVWSNWSNPSNGYGAIETAGNPVAKEPVSSGTSSRGSEYFRGIPYVSVAMRQTARDQQLHNMSTGEGFNEP